MQAEATPWQIAAECARSCISAAREYVPEDAWPWFVAILIEIAAEEQRKVALRKLHQQPRLDS